MTQDKTTDTRADPFLLKKYYDPLRVADVCDALDGIGYFNIGLVSPDIRALLRGTRFWGVAFTVRCVPANRPMWTLPTTDDIVDSHDIWFREVGIGVWRFYDQLKPGHVVVTDTGGAPPVGLWGSENSLRAIQKGAVGIVTDGHCRDSGELIDQKTPICSRGVARTIIPGRIEIIETQTRIGMGGVQVRPGDIVGCDDDGLVVVPLEVAQTVATHARAVLLADMRKRARHFAQLGMASDDSVDVEKIERHYAELDRASGNARAA
jgi:4-hydroxy-4-methyl-2-oxoglutarate aldolase